MFAWFLHGVVGWLTGWFIAFLGILLLASVNQVGWVLHEGVGSSQGPRPSESEFVEATPLLEALEQVIGLQWSGLQQALLFCHPKFFIQKQVGEPD